MIMYKLSIVEKAKRYDEAIKKLRSLHDNYDIVSTLIDVKEELENIFPELAESEGERIRKWCISHFKECINVIKDNDEYKEYLNNKVIPWLEKHSQVKEFPISQYENKTCKENDDSLTSEDERIGKAITEFFKNYSKNGTWKAIPNITKWIAWLENKIEQKEDKPPFNDPKYLAGFDIGREVQKIFDEQKPWSEEDERIIDRLCEILYACHSYGKCGLKLNEYSNLYDWLKSLRPQSTWKPSEGQMVALNCAITAASDDLVCLNVKDLESLYEQLKKLKG